MRAGEGSYQEKEINDAIITLCLDAYLIRKISIICDTHIYRGDMFTGVTYLQEHCGCQISSLRSGEHLFYRSLLNQLGGKGSHDEVSDLSVILLGDLLQGWIERMGEG